MAKKKKKPVKETTEKKQKLTSALKPRKKEESKVDAKKNKNAYKSFRLQKKIRHESPKKISSSFRLFMDAGNYLIQHWKLFTGVAVVYLVLTFILVGFGQGLDIESLRESLAVNFSGGIGQVGVGVALFTALVNSGGQPVAESGAVYQNLLVIIVSLAIIWLLRQTMAGEKVGVRDGFYKGMTPLIPSMLVLLVIALQLIPVLVGSFLYSVMFIGGLAPTGLEKLLWGALIFLLLLLSLYMLTSSLFAFYISTIPGMRPMRALKSAREIVRHRRWSVLRRLLFLPFSIVLIGMAVTIPFVWIWPPAVQWVYLVFSIYGLIFAHTYTYNLYKELI